jgi:hypothetical protein
MFCYCRWLLLGFKREFSFMESLRCFEILSSHHLELTSMEAEKTRRQELKREFENQGQWLMLVIFSVVTLCSI